MTDKDETVFVNQEKIIQEETTGKSKVSEELIQAYLDLGKACYAAGFDDPLPQLLPLFDRITWLRKERQRQNELCPGCGAPVKKEAVFCGNCGRRLKTV